MPVSAPQITDASYEQLLADALARISTHNPDWTNYNHSDPGITLLELFAFLTESLAYRANQIPERNRVRFLNLLQVPISGAATASGIVTFTNDHGPLAPAELGGGVELSAGSVSFHTDRGLDVLPVEAQVFTKQVVTNPPAAIVATQQQLYASFAGPPTSPNAFALYDTVPLDPAGAGVRIQGTADGALWIALLARQSDAQAASTPAELEAVLGNARTALAGSTLSLGFVPVIRDISAADLQPTQTSAPSGATPLNIALPNIPPGGELPAGNGPPQPQYRTLDARWPSAGLLAPGVIQVSLPDKDALGLWTNVGPLDAGVGTMPPSLDGTNLQPRLITWLRVQALAGSHAEILWMGINAATVTQRAHVGGEVLPPGTGQPDQTVTLAQTPVIADSVKLTVSGAATTETWQLIDDLLAAGPEISVPDPRIAPGVATRPPAPANVFTLDPASGLITFGDGARGRRPPLGAALQVDYDYGAGTAGNVGAGAINDGTSLPSGMTVANPVRTWGGADTETVAEAEKQTTRYLQNRDRLVTAEDFDTIVRRTPGVAIGRVEVLAATNPDVSPFTAGTAPGAVTLMLIPASDPIHPDSPEPDPAFLAAVAAHIEPRRLVTTQVFLRGPTYLGVWVSLGVDVRAGQSIADVTLAVKQEITRFLAPIDPTAVPWYADPPVRLDTPYVHPDDGWPLAKAVVALELMAVASRVVGVQYVQRALIGSGTGGPQDQIPITGLMLPRLLGISVVSGDPIDLDTLRGSAPATAGGGSGTPGPGGSGAPGPGPSLIPVPVIPDSC